MSLVGHVGPGVFLFVWGLVVLLRGGCRWQWMTRGERDALVKALIIAIFLPPAILIESYVQLSNRHTSYMHFSEPSKQHLLIYFMLSLSGLLAMMQLRRTIPKELSYAYDSLLLGFIALIFGSHNMGNPMFVGYHQYMGRLCYVSSIVYFAAVGLTKYGTSGNRTLYYASSLLFMTSGTWFADIGFSYYLYGHNKGGTKGFIMEPGASPEEAMNPSAIEQLEAFEKLNDYACLHFFGNALVRGACKTSLTSTSTSTNRRSFPACFAHHTCSSVLGSGRPFDCSQYSYQRC
jgi:hypothetical protein